MGKYQQKNYQDSQLSLLDFDCYIDLVSMQSLFVSLNVDNFGKRIYNYSYFHLHFCNQVKFRLIMKHQEI